MKKLKEYLKNKGGRDKSRSKNKGGGMDMDLVINMLAAAQGPVGPAPLTAGALAACKTCL